MNTRLLCGLILFSTLLCPVVWASEKALETADKAWRDGSPKRAARLYTELLQKLPKAYEPFRSLIIMRLARTHFHVGDKAQCLIALKRLDKLEYVPEHHALAAGELKAIIAGKGHPGHQKTAIPSIGKPVATINVNATTSLNDAVILARLARKKVGSGVIEIVLEPGVYLQRETVKLTAIDAGLVIRSRDPKKPAILTGGVVLKKWTKAAGAHAKAQLPTDVRDKVLTCDLKAHGSGQIGKLIFGGFSSRRTKSFGANFGTLRIPELFYKARPQTMARWPNEKLNKLPINANPAKPDPRFAKWAREKDLWLYGYWYWDWADAYEKVASIDKAGKITLAPPTNRYGFRRNMGCAINALCELDRPGEWYLDTAGGRIYYLPPANFDPSQCILSSFGEIIDAENCPGLQLRDIKIQYVRGNALVFKNCSELTLVGVDIQNCSGMGMYILGGKRHLLHSCTIKSMGRGGINISSGNWQKLQPGNSTIENCRISDLSRIDRTYTPALLIQGMGFRVRHNAFVDIPSSAIRLETCGSLIELNYFNRCVHESGDQGAIDMWANPLYRGNIIRWNDFDRIVNESGGHYGAAGVRHDDFISGFMVCENVFRKGSKHGFGSVQFNKGTDNYVEGNIIIDWHKAFTGHTGRGKTWRSRITTHGNSKRVLTETDWKSKVWREKYPMVRDLLNGDDNHNYLVDNQRFGTGSWGGVSGGVTFANKDGAKDFHGETLKSVKSALPPWRPIPLDLIGPYDASDE